MIGLKLKIIAAAVVLALIGLLAWRINAWRNGYLERDQAVADLAAYEAAVATREKEASEERARAALRSAELSGRLAKAEGDLNDLRANPVVSVQWRTKPGEPCPRAAISDDWFRVRHEAYRIASDTVQPAP